MGDPKSVREEREREWLVGEVAEAAALTDAERVAILRDLLRTTDAIRRSKSEAELRRDEDVRVALDEAPGRARYRAVVGRLS